MTDELDSQIRALHAERNRPRPSWSLNPKPNPDPPDTIEARRRIARSIAKTKATRR